MVTLEQVEQLDFKVKKAVGLIESLRVENSRLVAENNRLMSEITTLRNELQESSKNMDSLSDAQHMLEKGILGAIDQLTSIENNYNIETPVSVNVGEKKESSNNYSSDMEALPDVSEEEKAEDVKNQQPLDIF
jgi:FtsZ-binding cell division protein ZapB